MMTSNTDHNSTAASEAELFVSLAILFLAIFAAVLCLHAAGAGGKLGISSTHGAATQTAQDPLSPLNVRWVVCDRDVHLNSAAAYLKSVDVVRRRRAFTAGRVESW